MLLLWIHYSKELDNLVPCFTWKQWSHLKNQSNIYCVLLFFFLSSVAAFYLFYVLISWGIKAGHTWRLLTSNMKNPWKHTDPNCWSETSFLIMSSHRPPPPCVFKCACSNMVRDKQPALAQVVQLAQRSKPSVLSTHSLPGEPPPPHPVIQQTHSSISTLSF